MKHLLYVLMLGAAGWIIFEVFELTGGVHRTVISAITVAAFLLVAIGIWGLHQSQAPGKNVLSWIGAISISLAFATFAIVDLWPLITSTPLGSGRVPLIRFGTVLAIVGFISFGISIVRTKYYPQWTAVALWVLFIGGMWSGSRPGAHIINIVMSALLIFMGVHALRASKQKGEVV